MSSDLDRRLLEAIEQDPDATQADLATQLGVAVGTVNWYLKRLISKGCVIVTHLQRRKLRYFVTSQGLALKARLTTQYVKASLRVYEELRQKARKVLGEVKEAGYAMIHLEGDSEAADIFRLTCLEGQVKLIQETGADVPMVRVEGLSFVVQWPDGERSVVDSTSIQGSSTLDRDQAFKLKS